MSSLIDQKTRAFFGSLNAVENGALLGALRSEQMPLAMSAFQVYLSGADMEHAARTLFSALKAEQVDVFLARLPEEKRQKAKAMLIALNG